MRTPSNLSTLLAALLVLLTVALTACSAGLKPTQFTNERFDFSYVERVAVVPFENLTNDRQAGFRATRLTVTELLASGAVDVVEPGEVLAALAKIPEVVPGRFSTPSTEQTITLGKELGVQALIIGNVSQSDSVRSGSVTIQVVTLDLHMVETESGATVWGATHTEKSSGLGAKILGTAGAPISETTRRCVQQVLRTLIE